MKRLALVLLLIFVAIIGFYFWASSARYSSNEALYTIYTSSNPSEFEKDTFSIMTFNIGYLSGMTNNIAVDRSKELFDDNAFSLIQLLKKNSVDILATQEIDFGSSRSFEVDQHQLILEEGNFDFGAKAVNWDKRYVPYPYWPIHQQFGKILSGQALASKFPILTNEVEILDKPVDQPFYYKDFYLDRLIQTIRLSINGRELTILNIHLEAFSEKTREIHLERVFEKFKTYAMQGPTILLGDFNESILPLVNSKMLPFYNQAIFDSAISLDYINKEPFEHFTFSAELPEVKIDYIFYSSNFIEMLDAKTITETNLLSDHLPVMMRFKFKDVN